MSSRHLKHFLETKGLFHGGERAAQVLWRFVRGRKRFQDMLVSLEREFKPLDARITFCVTASLLSRNLLLIRRLHDLGHEIASHSYFHNRLSYLSREEQLEAMRRSYDSFRDVGIDVRGFRCPYLSANVDTILALMCTPYSWTSQHMIYWSNHFDRNTRRLFSLYQTSSCEQAISLPRWSDSILEIPISLPDDEMLVERLRVRSSEGISRSWGKLRKIVHEDGELLHLLFHPERFCLVKSGLLEVVGRSHREQPSTWMPTLSGLASWWKVRSRAEWKSVGVKENPQQVGLEAPENATILIKGVQAGKAEPIFGDYYPVKPAAHKNGLKFFPTGGERRFSIGISQQAPRELVTFLRGEGFWVEFSERPDSHALFFGEGTTFNENEKRSVLQKADACPMPLLRLWRWPDGHRSALVISSDIDAISLLDFWDRARNF